MMTRQPVPDLTDLQRIHDEADCLADHATVQANLDRMAGQISARLGNSNPLVITVMNGGLIFAGQLLPRLNFALEVGYVHASRYGHALTGKVMDWRVRPQHDVRDRTVLVLDDILDEGHTLAEILRYLRQEGAREVLSAVLVHKRHDRKALPDMRADFTGLEVADRFLFGYGMDYKGYWRNAAGIFAVKGH